MSFEAPISPPRHLRAEDFPAEQVAEWTVATGQGRERASGTGPASEWLVAYTNPKREPDVARELKRRTFDTYVPVMSVTKRRKTVRRPLLPRYVFVGFRPGLSFLDLDETPGLEAMVRIGADPAAVQPRVIAILRAEEARGVYDFTTGRLAEAAAQVHAEAKARAWEDKLKAFTPGTLLVIVNGPWRMFKGRVTEALPPDRIAVVIKLIGREHAVPMLLDDVERAP